jgi:hypothetical protein
MEKLFEDIKVTYDVWLYDDNNSLDEYVDTPEDDLYPEPFGVKLRQSRRYMLTNGFFKNKTISNNEEAFKGNYGNPFAKVSMSRRIASVTKNEDKVSIKIFRYSRGRNVGKKYFRVRTNLEYISYNIKTNALYYGKIINYHLKRKAIKKCNRVLLTSDWLESINCYINGSLGHSDSQSNMLESFVNGIPGTEKYSGEPKMRFYKYFLEKSGAKLPNNWDAFICVYPQPTKKLLKKVNYKFIDSYMDLHKLKGDKIKRCLHLVKVINLEYLHFAYQVFGEKYILSKPDEDIVKILQFSNYYGGTYYNLNDYTKAEKNNAYEIFKLILDEKIDLSTFTDHIRFKLRLSDINPVKWKSKTLDDFNDEHYEWSEKVADLSKCRYDRFYGNDFKGWVEQNIAVNEIDYYPVLLTNSSEYNFESMTQNNCVRTYINKPSAMIISLREGSNTGKNKLTIEYNLVCTDWETKEITLKRVQTKRKSNMIPEPEWDEPLRILDLRIKELCKQKLFTLPKIQVTFKNMSKIESGLNIGDDGFIQWDNRAVQAGHSLNFYEFDDLP